MMGIRKNTLLLIVSPVHEDSSPKATGINQWQEGFKPFRDLLPRI